MLFSFTVALNSFVCVGCLCVCVTQLLCLMMCVCVSIECVFISPFSEYYSHVL